MSAQTVFASRGCCTYKGSIHSKDRLIQQRLERRWLRWDARSHTSNVGGLVGNACPERHLLFGLQFSTGLFVMNFAPYVDQFFFEEGGVNKY